MPHSPTPARALHATRLCKRYGKSIILDHFSIAIDRGEVHGLLGPNGSGKTTSLNLLTGLLVPDSGEVWVCGASILKIRARSFLGFAPDDLPLPGSLTGREYLEFHDAMRGRDDRTRTATLIELFDLDEAIGKQIVEYSHGMKRKIQFIAAISHHPELLILDEPYRGLDPEAAATLHSVIRSMANNGSGVLIATHDIWRAERDCDAVTILNRGRIIAAGRPSQLIADTQHAESIEEVFMSATGLDAKVAGRSALIDNLFLASSSDQHS